MPETPQALPLHAVETEVAQLTELLPRSTVLSGSQATQAAVLGALPNHSIAHFSCHGLSDYTNPGESRLLLYDHAVNPFTITALSRLRLTAPELAYLSACETATTRYDLTDEAVHITSAFLLAGYQNVIGTLWPIEDVSAAEMAYLTYQHLALGHTGVPDTSRAAHALHYATLQLREKHPRTPALWSGYIHAGL